MHRKLGIASLCFSLGMGMAMSARAADEASITGRAMFDGKASPVKPLPPGKDEYCKKVHTTNPIIRENVPLVSKDGGLKNVFVWVKSGLPKGQKFEVPKEPLVLHQKGCRYIPHVFGVMEGQTLQVIDDDGINHNIHGFPKNNKEFNFSQSAKGQKTDWDKLLKSDDFGIKCDVHDWMNARCFVKPHPFFAVTDDEGKFTIKGLPAGEYELEFVHETLGTQTKKVKVEAGKATTCGDAKFKEKGKTPIPAKPKK